MIETVVGSVFGIFLLITFWTGRNVGADCYHHRVVNGGICAWCNEA